MKRTSYYPIIFLVLAVVLSMGSSAVQQSQSADVLLGEALHQEEVEGDLEAAIATYKKLLAAFPDNRPLAAQAQFRIGMCYESLGRKEAQKAYEAVLSKYTDQPEFASRARDRLAVLRAPAAAHPKDSRLTIRSVPHMDMYGDPSPDGRYLAYIDWETANVAVYEIATDTTRALTKTGSWGEVERYPENLIWSPDSRQVSYTWNMWDPGEEGSSELRVVSLDKGTPPRTVFKDERYLWPWDWSPDGSHILCGLQVGGPVMDRALINVATGAVETLELPSGSLGGGYRFTPSGDSILYSRPSDGKWNPDDIYLYDLESGESTTIVEHPADDMVVGILPGTDWLLFTSNRRGSLDLWGVRLQEGKAEGQPLLIKQGLRRFWPLNFTNDGSLYYAVSTVTDDIFLADFDPGTQKVLGEPSRLSSRWEGTTMDASFSPDGKRIAYVAYRGIRSRTHVADSLVVQSLQDKNAPPLVVDFSEFHLYHVSVPCWAGDGQSIVLTGRRRGEEGNVRGLFRVDLSSLSKTNIKWAAEGYGLGWSECARTTDSVYFAFGGPQSPNSVMRIGLDGRDEKQVFRAPEGQRIKHIALSPDEKTLSIIIAPSLSGPSQCVLLLQPLDGGPARRIHEFIQYTGGFVGHTWAPDGKFIYYMVKDKQDEHSWSVQRISAASGGPAETVYRRNHSSFGIAFHPNGRRFAFTGRVGSSNTSEAWIMENLIEELKRKTKTEAEKSDALTK